MNSGWLLLCCKENLSLVCDQSGLDQLCKSLMNHETLEHSQLSPPLVSKQMPAVNTPMGPGWEGRAMTMLDVAKNTGTWSPSRCSSHREKGAPLSASSTSPLFSCAGTAGFLISRTTLLPSPPPLGPQPQSPAKITPRGLHKR